MVFSLINTGEKPAQQGLPNMVKHVMTPCPATAPNRLSHDITLVRYQW